MTSSEIVNGMIAVWYAKTGRWPSNEHIVLLTENVKSFGITNVQKGTPKEFESMQIYKNDGELDLIEVYAKNPDGSRTLYWNFGYG